MYISFMDYFPDYYSIWGWCNIYKKENKKWM